MRSATRQRLVSLCTLGVALATAIGFAVSTRGFAIDRVDLNDAGIWVTNNADDVYGRINLTAGSLDGYLTPGSKSSSSLDVFQDGASVVARDIANGLLIPVDPAAVANAVAGQAVAAPDARVGMGAGTIAVLDPSTGQVRTASYAPDSVPTLAGVKPSAPARVTLGAATPAPAGSAAGRRPGCRSAPRHGAAVRTGRRPRRP